MAPRASSDPEQPPNALPYSYSPLSAGDHHSPANRRRSSKGIIILVSCGLLAVGLMFIALVGVGNSNDDESAHPVVNNDVCLLTSKTNPLPGRVMPVARGTEKGVSEKSFRPLLGVRPFSWTSNMLNWQRTAFHFQPTKNWMNDPNGPVFYKGWYHLFYQYNPEGAVWGNIVWGHAVSKDMIHWRHLPIAMEADHWYDIDGVWTGSATILSDGSLVMLYTGSTNESVQVQNLAYPADPADPLLIKWVKYSANPVLVPPPGIHFKDFRDPTTAWATPEGKWRITIGSKVNKTGISLVYDTEDFKTYEQKDVLLHGVPGTGMWECVDFYPVSKSEENGLDTSANGPGVKHVVKASLDDDRNDYYAIGSYDANMGKWIPDDPRIDVGIGLRYDYGIFYASKTFYDQNKKRRVLWGWIKETDSESADVKKGWASLMGLPRTVLLDKKTGSNVIQWPVEEVERLRSNSTEFSNVVLGPGSVVPLNVGPATQLDIMADFEVDKEAIERMQGSEVVDNCGGHGGAATRGALGPFGFLVLADNDLSEKTPIYFYIGKGGDGKLQTFFGADETRSSEANDVDKAVYGSIVPVLKGEILTLRILVDHSIVESFAQGGRSTVTSRVYPTKAIYEDAKLFLFNNATDARISASIKIWQMNSATIYT